MEFRSVFIANPAQLSVRLLVITERQYAGLDLMLGSPTPADSPKQTDSLMIF